MDNFAHDVLKLLPGGNNLFVAPNGHLRERNYNHQHHSQSLHSSNMHHMTPTTFQAQTDAPLGISWRQAQHILPANSLSSGTNHLQHSNLRFVSGDSASTTRHRTNQ